MATIGKLIFEMSANVARLQTDMNKARGTVQTAMDGIKSAAQTARRALETIGLGLGAAGFVEMVRGAIDAQDALYKLSQRTGVAVETLSGLRLIAKQAGTDMETTAWLINRLEKSMFQLATEPTASKQMTAAFTALGYSTKDVEAGLKNIQTFLPDLAKRLTETGTASQQAALATVLLGRSGAEALPFLHQLAEAGQIQADVTTAQGKRAAEFKDKLDALDQRAEEFKERLANGLLPSLTNIANAFVGVANDANTGSKSIQAITTFLQYAMTAAGSFWLGLLDLGDGLGAFAAQANALLHGDLAAFKEIGAERDRQAAANEAALARFQKQILHPAAAPAAAAASPGKPLDIGALVPQKAGKGSAGGGSTDQSYWDDVIKNAQAAGRELKSMQAEDAKRQSALEQQNQTLDQQAQSGRTSSTRSSPTGASSMRSIPCSPTASSRWTRRCRPPCTSATRWTSSARRRKPPTTSASSSGAR